MIESGEFPRSAASDCAESTAKHRVWRDEPLMSGTPLWRYMPWVSAKSRCPGPSGIPTLRRSGQRRRVPRGDWGNSLEQFEQLCGGLWPGEVKALTCLASQFL